MLCSSITGVTNHTALVERQVLGRHAVFCGTPAHAQEPKPKSPMRWCPSLALKVLLLLLPLDREPHLKVDPESAIGGASLDLNLHMLACLGKICSNRITLLNRAAGPHNPTARMRLPHDKSCSCDCANRRSNGSGGTFTQSSLCRGQRSAGLRARSRRNDPSEREI